MSSWISVLPRGNQPLSQRDTHPFPCSHSPERKALPVMWVISRPPPPTPTQSCRTLLRVGCGARAASGKPLGTEIRKDSAVQVGVGWEIAPVSVGVDKGHLGKLSGV